MNRPPAFSIVIPSHNRPDLLHHCLESVARHAPADTEVIVVDDGSPGGAVSSVARAFAGVHVVRRDRPGGFCLAANAGIAAARAPVVELLNDDAEVSAGWAAAALPWFADETVAAVAPLVLQLDPVRLARGLPPLIDTAGDEYDPGGFARKRGHGRVFRRDGGAPWNRSGQVWGASACAGFYRRAALLAAGCFPRHFGAYFEDVDLSFRLRRLGFQVIYDPDVVVWHRVSSSYGAKSSRRRIEQQSCNEERVFWRNTRGRDLVRRLPRHAAVLCGKAVCRVQEGTLVPWLLGRVRALGG
jgi:GT2 family glycosyltransferase